MNKNNSDASWEHKRYEEIANENFTKNSFFNPNNLKNRIANEDAIEFKIMRDIIEKLKEQNKKSFSKESMINNNNIINVYNTILDTFDAPKTTINSTKECLEKIKEAYPKLTQEKGKQLQMLYWQSRCYEKTDAKKEKPEMKFKNNTTNYNRLKSMADILKDQSISQYYFHAKRCVEEVGGLNTSETIKQNITKNALNNSKDNTKLKEKCIFTLEVLSYGANIEAIRQKGFENNKDLYR